MTSSPSEKIPVQSPSTQESSALKQTFIDRLKEDYLKALSSLDNDVKKLVQNGQEAKALMLFSDNLTKIIEIKDTLTTFYTLFLNNVSVLERFGSERLKQLGYELQPIYDTLKDGDAEQAEIEQHILKNFRSLGIKKTHWYIKEIVLTEIEYMLDTLQILIEPDFLPLLESTQSTGETEDRPDRYIPPDVKLAVWRRDQGKCVQCGSKGKLEYDHIIPVSKGGSNTERNIQLLCEKCNREKATNIL
ncbi:MAG: HNH endonuclease signature motif containing protein [bacterium]